jgi:hypothetical protein
MANFFNKKLKEHHCMPMVVFKHKENDIIDLGLCETQLAHLPYESW